MTLQINTLDRGTLNFNHVQSISINDQVHGSFACYPYHTTCIVHLKHALLSITNQNQKIHKFELEEGCLLISVHNKVQLTATVLRDR
jgi:F0F1-type ATP synthase epsilon subunit